MFDKEAIRSNSSEYKSFFNQFAAFRKQTGNLSFSPDHRRIAYIVKTDGQFNIWWQEITGGWATQVTTFTQDRVRGFIWSPNGVFIGFSDTEGNEKGKIFTIPEKGGRVHEVLSSYNATFGFSSSSLSPDGTLLALYGNDRMSSSLDLLLLNLQTEQVERIVFGNDNSQYRVGNWSPDGRFLTVLELIDNSTQKLHLYDMTTKSLELLLPSSVDEEPFAVQVGPWLADGSGFYLITDRGREFKGVAFYSLRSRSMNWVVEWEHDVEHVALGTTDYRLIICVNESGYSRLYQSVQGEAFREINSLPSGVIETMALSYDQKHLGFRLKTPTRPNDLYILELDQEPPDANASMHPVRQLTFSMLGGLQPEELIEPQLVAFPSFEGHQIPAWLYVPRNARSTGPTSLLIALHGGPEHQERPGFNAFYQRLLSLGIAILAPNIRGSTGYGKAYQRMIYRNWGGLDVKDVKGAVEYVSRLSWLKGGKIGLFGGSYGGFLALSAAVQLPEYWSAVVTISAPSNLLSYVRRTPCSWRSVIARLIGDPEQDAEDLWQRSPLCQLESLRCPLLVMHGQNDPRVPIAESDQLVAHLQELEKEVQYEVFENEGHGFNRRTSELRMSWQATDFLVRHLLS